MSEHVFGMKPGETLEMKGPLLKIKYEPNRWSKIGMIAGKSAAAVQPGRERLTSSRKLEGLTPMLQVIKKILNNPDDKTKVSLLFANQEGRDILLKSEVRVGIVRVCPGPRKYLTFPCRWASWTPSQRSTPTGSSESTANRSACLFPPVLHFTQVQYTLDRPPSGWKGETGFVSENMVEKYMPGKDEDAIIFVCGPAAMVAHVSGAQQNSRLPTGRGWRSFGGTWHNEIPCGVPPDEMCEPFRS
ncbi:MAG: hypothetical protein BJ554DRAFT_7254 [Olpidium bornovanus]|uniref:Oxidoreductase FAD/NAD(P)-binding domain-containing protein n=1 Tax=Olpidium bornovanus TaxID=278681 RepID=A0A8H7ZWC9_9FUNG|nr:MAG: hypothetical protein BJ554DRAFT_7254 [Olpidium bornovanus]